MINNSKDSLANCIKKKTKTIVGANLFMNYVSIKLILNSYKKYGYRFYNHMG